MEAGTYDLKPFAKGRSRQAHKGVLTKPPKVAGREIVVKKPINRSYAGLVPRMEADIKVAQKAQEYAKMFKSAYRATPIDFQQPVEMVTEEDNEKVLVEYYLDGTYIKWIGNNGYINHDETTGNECLMAFAHWTWVKSGKQELVCDLQGVKGNPSGYHLTDPAIHSVKEEYGSTDLGKEGIDLFFQTHTCNSACVSLGIQKNRPKPTTEHLQALLALIGNQMGTSYQGELPRLLQQVLQEIGKVLPTRQSRLQRRQNTGLPYGSTSSATLFKQKTTYRY